MLEIID